MPDQNSKQPDETVILLHEGVLKSWARDGMMLAMLGGLPWFNANYAGGSGWIYAAIAFAWFITIIGKAALHRSNAKMTPAEARAYLDSRWPA